MALGLGIANHVVESAKFMHSSVLLHEFKAAWDGDARPPSKITSTASIRPIAGVPSS